MLTTKLINMQFKRFLLLIGILVLITSCGTRKDIVYFQDVDIMGVSTPIYNYDYTFRPDDMLTINVSALDQDLVRPFNLQAVSYIDTNGSIGRTTQQTYLIDSYGNIDFPVLGTLKISGLTRVQATKMIRDMLIDYIKDPIVNIRIVNFKITILGEVNRPGSYTINNERITILEAIGFAGDLTIQANRKNVLVIREENGKITYNRVDLTSEDIFNSSYYHLNQNDVIYIEPNNSRIKSSTVGPNVSATLGVVSTLATVAALIVSITK